MNLLEKTERVVREAGKLIVDSDADRNKVIQKGEANFVTQVDLKVQEYIAEALQEILPESHLITEESFDNRFDLTNPTWILDPVDGTTNLMHNFRHSAISLALYVEGKPLLGIIYNPTSEEMFTAEAGRGAFLNGKMIHVSEYHELKQCLIGFGTTPYDRRQAGETFRITERVFMHSQEIRRSGSAALDIAYVACGRLDGFFELCLQPWDYAAGILLLKEAGGKITDWQGKDLKVITPNRLLATNGYIHEALRELLQ